MKCPYCGNEMQLGYIQCRDGVNWTLKKQPIASLSFLGKDRISLQNISDKTSDSAVYAYNCHTCNIVLIPYGNDFKAE